MISICKPDPLVGEELVRVVLEKFGTELVFEGHRLQIGGQFLLKHNGTILADFQPESQQGDLAQLWRLIGSKVIEISWGQMVMVQFDRGLSIEILPTPGRFRGTITSLKTVKSLDGKIGIASEDF